MLHTSFFFKLSLLGYKSFELNTQRQPTLTYEQRVIAKLRKVGPYWDQYGLPWGFGHQCDRVFAMCWMFEISSGVVQKGRLVRFALDTKEFQLKHSNRDPQCVCSEGAETFVRIHVPFTCSKEHQHTTNVPFMYQ